MNDEEQFIAHIQSNPEDKETREVLADLLLDKGCETEAMYVRFPPDKVSIEFKFRFNAVKEVKCPECKSFSSGDHRSTSPVPMLSAAYCSIHNWFPFYFERGNTYKFENGTWQYWGGIDNKWWVKI